MKDISDMSIEELKSLDFEAEPFGYKIVNELIRRLEEATEGLRRANNHEW